VGLGLSIVSRLATLMRLSVSIRSQSGRGTCVRIEGLEAAPAEALTVVPARSRPASQLKGLRVLLVEDDPDVLLATATLLEKWGCIVQSETGLPYGIVRCDLLITDFDLGAETTGADCIAWVRRFGGQAVPAIVTTGHDEGRVREDLDDPEIPILCKPVRPAELRSTVMAQKLLADRRAGSSSAVAS
jgi:CheY-like chemotaxis protein